MRNEQKMIAMRKAEKDDIQAICSFDQTAIDNRENRRDFIAKSVKSGICFVADIDGKVVGYTVLDYTFHSNGMIVPGGFIDNLDGGDPEVVYLKRIRKDR